jgi:prepilin-type N-terminal cleavage/methylation domain-containing protein
MSDNQCPSNESPVTRRGFTLIELLVVIAIIAMLAALIVGLGRPAYRMRIESRAKAELNMLVGAIEAYHKKFGFYPPDNANDTSRPPLYYELVGWMGTKQELEGVTNRFGVAGFVNSVVAADQPELDRIMNSDDERKHQRKNFLPNLKPKGFAAIPGQFPQTFVLTFPAIGPAGEFNTWNYRSTKPVNNTESFDLWLDVILSSKTNTIGNWKE